MKVLLIVVALGSVSARGSGPYLPSGWRPDGPAFDLPTKQRPENPFRDLILQGSEASGSDALREYGPPKLSQDLIQQSLPNEIIEQTFASQQQFDVEKKIEKLQDQPQVTTEEQVETTTLEAENPIVTYQDYVTEALAFEYTGDITEAPLSQNIESSVTVEDKKQEIVTLPELLSPSLSSVEIELEQTVQQLVQNVEQAVEKVIEEEDVSIVQNNEKERINLETNDNAKIKSEDEHFINKGIKQDIEKYVKNVEKEAINAEQSKEQIVQNIPDILNNVDNEITQQVAGNSDKSETNISVQELSWSSGQVPEGFLEYGPPGFQEYGPPKENLAIGAIEELPDAEAIQRINESRRRRFSPKFGQQ
ncbi:unnamed protein product [Leptosia nina]|uniref:Uncharacterized protein n=1 Tax=Leptosia nina TaxID=320188 RepID=A0AAV1JIV4_9NEOP